MKRVIHDRRSRRQESDWWLGGFLVAFCLGLGATLIYGWYLNPSTPHTTPAQLAPADKETYILLVGAAYRFDGDLAKARDRLAKLKDDEIDLTVRTLAEQYINQQADVRDIRSLVELADGLGQKHGLFQIYLPTPKPPQLTTFSNTASASSPATPSPTQVPTDPVISTPTRPPISSPPSTQAPNPTTTPRLPNASGEEVLFGLAQSVPLCDNSGDTVLRVYVQDRQGQGLAGKKIIVNWPTGKDIFFTGLKPEIDRGYADFVMDIDQVYQVTLADLDSITAKNVNQQVRERCANRPNNISPSWQVVFQQE